MTSAGVLHRFKSQLGMSSLSDFRQFPHLQPGGNCNYVLACAACQVVTGTADTLMTLLEL